MRSDRVTLDVGRAWSATVADVQRRLPDFLLPAAAFGFLPALVASRFADAAQVGEPAARLAQLAAGAIGIIGQAAIMLMVLIPGTDVGEAIRRGARATPRIILASLTIALAAVPLALAFKRFGDQPALGPSLLLLVLAGVTAFLALRLSMLAGAILLDNNGVIDSLRRSFALTAGQAGRLLLLLGAILLMFAVTSAVVGAVGLMLTGGTPEDPSFVTELLLAMVGAVFSIFIAVATAHAYRQLAALR